MSAASRPGAWTSSSRASACGSSRSEVSRVCEALDEHVEAFRTRPLEGRYPYLFLDAGDHIDKEIKEEVRELQAA